MFFNSLDFGVFFPIVFLFYWFVTNGNLKLQNFLILIASYIFYGWWDWRFLSLIFFSTIVDYSIGVKLHNEENRIKRKALLVTSICANIGFLGFFKYSNFFLDSFISAFSFFGVEISANSLNIILPVGISFYTFQTLSYTIDVYKRKLEASKDFVAFAAFVSFFPQLVAGPIERAKNLLPQFNRKRIFIYTDAVEGMRQILWGLFKKVVIADNCAEIANLVFNNSSEYSGFSLILGAVFFAFQIYGDFSGYSDIAIGISKLFGFNLMKNFNYPYFSRDIAEFWRRWHISLSTWFRDYLYIPLGGSKGSLKTKIRNTFVIFIVSGFWHGANWTFIIWGFLNALYFLPLLLRKENRRNLDVVAKGKLLPGLKELYQMGITFFLTVLAWIFFRAENLEHSLNYIQNLFIGLFGKVGYIQAMNLIQMEIGIMISILIIVFLIIEWIGRENDYAISKFLTKCKLVYRLAFYYAVVVSILWFWGNEQQFIYFQF